MIRMIAWTMITWRRSHDSCSLVWVPYSGSNFNRHHASVLKFRVCTPCINTRLQHWTSVLKLFIYSIWKYYYITKYTVLKPLFFRPEASGVKVPNTPPALATMHTRSYKLGTKIFGFILAKSKSVYFPVFPSKTDSFRCPGWFCWPIGGAAALLGRLKPSESPKPVKKPEI